MKGSNVAATQNVNDVQDIAAGSSTDDAVPPLTTGVVGVYPDALRVLYDCLGVFTGKPVPLDVLEVRFVPLECYRSHDRA